MKLLIMQFPPTSRHLISSVHIFSLAPCSQTPSEQVSRPYTTTGKIRVSHILIFTFQTADEMTKVSGLNGSKHYPNSNSS
jgi:hypothetical protein